VKPFSLIVVAKKLMVRRCGVAPLRRLQSIVSFAILNSVSNKEKINLIIILLI